MNYRILRDGGDPVPHSEPAENALPDAIFASRQALVKGLIDDRQIYSTLLC